MTAGEFAKAYGIEYQIVRAATFRTATRQRASWMLDYGEPELRQAVRDELLEKLIYYRDRLTKIGGELDKLDRKAASET